MQLGLSMEEWSGQFTEISLRGLKIVELFIVTQHTWRSDTRVCSVYLVSCSGVFRVDGEEWDRTSLCDQSAVVLCRQPH